MKNTWQLGVALCMVLCAPAALVGAFAWDGRLDSSLWVPPYGLQLGGELGAAWQIWGEDPREVLPPAGMVLGAPWKFGFVRAVGEATADGGNQRLGALAHLEPIGIFQIKAGMAKNWRRVPVSGTFAPGLETQGISERQILRTMLTPLPWAYGYACYEGSWERVTGPGSNAVGFADPESALAAQGPDDVLVTHNAYFVWIPSPRLNITFIAGQQQFQGSGDAGNYQLAKIDWPRGRWLPSLYLGRWETRHTELPIIALFKLTWVGLRALDR